jgi:hypothetical protein
MKLERIVTLANQNVRLWFLAMERSLRATGCRLPLWVIPYDDHLFDLPPNARWWHAPEIVEWVDEYRGHRAMRKYQCFTVDNYQFVDTDICFLKNPEEVLAPYSGFVTSCCHWHNPGHTYTAESERFIRQSTTTWPRLAFNDGQFACDRVLYTVDALQRVAEDPRYIHTALRLPWGDQPGLNLLVWLSGVPITNLTLPPTCMESTWAGDYPDDYQPFWADRARQPYLIHWAGNTIEKPRPVNDIFLNYLTADERREWDQQVQQTVKQRDRAGRSVRSRLRRLARACRAFSDSLSES